MDDFADVPALDKLLDRFIPAAVVTAAGDDKPTATAPASSAPPSSAGSPATASTPPTLADYGYGLDEIKFPVTAKAPATAATTVPDPAPSASTSGKSPAPMTSSTPDASLVPEAYPLSPMTCTEWSNIIGSDKQTNMYGLDQTPSNAPALIRDGAGMRYTVNTHLPIDARFGTAGSTFPRPANIRAITKYFPDVTRNLALVRTFDMSARFVCGITNNANIEHITPQSKVERVDPSEYIRWAWNVYNGSLLAEVRSASGMVEAVQYPDKNPAEHVVYTENPMLGPSVIDYESVYGGADTPSPSAAATNIEEDEDLKLREAPITRPNGDLYFPRRVTSIGKDILFDVELVRNAREGRIPVLFYGPPGTGKSAMAEAALEGVITIAGTADTETADFIGSYVQLPDGSYEWVDGPLIEAMETGNPLFIDEIALIDSRVLAIVYSVMDGRDEIRITANPKRGTVKAAPGFYVLGACNPDVPGAVMSEALLSRFSLQIEVTTDFDTLVNRLGVDPEIIIVAKNLANLKEKGEVTSAPQTRELLAFQRIKNTMGRDLAIANLISSADPTDKDAYTRIVSSAYDVKAKGLKI